MKLEDAIFLLGKKTLELELLQVSAIQNKQAAEHWFAQEQKLQYDKDVKQFSTYLDSLGSD